MTHSGPIYDAPSPQRERARRATTVVKQGVGFGSALAIAISWSQHQSILWAIVHGFLSWLYVVYYAVTRG